MSELNLEEIKAEANDIITRVAKDYEARKELPNIPQFELEDNFYVQRARLKISLCDKISSLQAENDFLRNRIKELEADKKALMQILEEDK